jgi:hypothetical protein
MKPVKSKIVNDHSLIGCKSKLICAYRRMAARVNISASVGLLLQHATNYWQEQAMGVADALLVWVTSSSDTAP